MLKINPVIATPEETARMRQALWMLVEMALEARSQNSIEIEPCHKNEEPICLEKMMYVAFGMVILPIILLAALSLALIFGWVVL